MSESVLARVRVVLQEPQDLVNVAATVRAMKNMGLTELVLVRPAAFDARRILGVAHDTVEFVERIRVTPSIERALEGCVLVAAFTARRRSAKWAVATPREAATQLLEAAVNGPVAIVFGREDRGLPNETLDRSHLHVTIPTTEYASLNLAQAVVIALYELHVAAGDTTRPGKLPRKDTPPATAEQLELYFSDAAHALEAIDFFKTRFQENVMRTVRSVVMRAQPNARELSLMRAMEIEVVRKLERVMRTRPENE